MYWPTTSWILLLQLGVVLAIPIRLRTVDYTGHQIIRVTDPPSTLLEGHRASGLEIWARRGNKSVDLHINPTTRGVLESIVSESQLQVLVPDLQVAVDTWSKENRGFSGRKSTDLEPARHLDPTPTDDTSYFTTFHAYPDMIAALNGTCRDAGLLCTFVGSIGQSVEGRDIAAVRIGAPSASPKPQVYVQATLHAREWGAASTAHYIAHALLTNYTLDNDTRRFLDTYDVHIVPVANPDGYTWTWEENGDRLWRKNRRQNADGSIGVDLNRNWDFSWDDLSGSSDVAQDETYRGPSPGSEPETRALAKYFSSLTNVVASIDMHTFSQLILLPWGNTRTPTPGNDDYVAVGQLMHSAIAAVNGSDYLSVPSMDLYPTSGTASDWFYSQTKRGTDGRSLAPYGISIELRPSDEQGLIGFLLPATQIIPLGQEILPALVAYADYAAGHPLIPLSAGYGAASPVGGAVTKDGILMAGIPNAF